MKLCETQEHLKFKINMHRVKKRLVLKRLFILLMTPCLKIKHKGK